MKSVSKNQSNQINKLVSFVLIFVLAIVASARGDTPDTQSYAEIYYASKYFPFGPLQYYSEYNVEFGYGIMSWIFNSLNLSHRWVFFIISLLTTYLIYHTAKNFNLSLIEVLPYYLGTFYLLQQLIQIRQGLATALAFYAISLFAVREKLRLKRQILLLILAISTHVVSVIPQIAALVVNGLTIASQKWSARIIAIFIAIISFGLAKLVISIEAINAIGKINIYLNSEEYGYSRNIFDIANVRSLILFTIFLCAPTKILTKKYYFILLSLFAMSLGVRIGFLETAIFSGRIATALSFGEIFLLPLLLKYSLQSNLLKISISVFYLFASFAATANIQVPGLIDDYVRS